MTKQRQYLNTVKVPENQIRVRSLLVNLELMQAVSDLENETFYSPVGEENTGPYALEIRLDDDKMIIEASTRQSKALAPVSFSVRPYKRLIQDYFLIVESYEKARVEGNVSRLESIDMGRRGIHNEGADLLQERLKPYIEMNNETARRLFTLVCILCAVRKLVWL